MDEALWFDVMHKSICLPVRKGGGKRSMQGQCEVISGKCRALRPNPVKMVSLSFWIFHHLKQSLKASSGTFQLTNSYMF